MVRVVSGSAKGMSLKTFDSDKTRATLDRVKEAMFSILYPYTQGNIFIDLFAGNGSLGIEALSRGAKEVYFNDSSKKCTFIINENLEKTNLQNSAFVYNLDYMDFLKRFSQEEKKADLIILDPPYGQLNISKIIKDISSFDICTKPCYIMVEHLNEELLEEEIGSFKKIKEKKYGRVKLTLYMKEV